uniref:Riboflavin transporter n=1 Tax=Panagrolaimus superbus TaxID=310955 RepID=A0A914YZI8_9BILA
MFNLRMYILVAIFGSSSWLSTNSVWQELSLMVVELPEGWNLPSYLSAVVQIGSIGPLIFLILKKCTTFDFPKAPLIQGMLILITICSLATAFLWDKTAFIFGEERSISLIIIMFFMALVNTTSNVLFMPYMATFHPTYLTAYFHGMGLSALIPSAFSLIQGTGSYDCVKNETTGDVEPHYLPPAFSVGVYNLIMFGWLILAVGAFAILHWGRHLIQFKTAPSSTVEWDFDKEKHEVQLATSDLPADVLPPLQSQSVCENKTNDRKGFARYCILLCYLAFICIQMNGVVPDAQSYAALPYSQLTYHLALAIKNVTHALACFIPIWYQPTSLRSLTTLTLIATGFCGYIVLLAFQSPYPFLHHSFWGGFFSVSAAIVSSALQSYLRTVFTAVIRDDNPESDSRLFWCGIFMQIGSVIGTAVMFPLINFAHIFKSGPACD